MVTGAFNIFAQLADFYCYNNKFKDPPPIYTIREGNVIQSAKVVS